MTALCRKCNDHVIVLLLNVQNGMQDGALQMELPACCRAQKMAMVIMFAVGKARSKTSLLRVHQHKFHVRKMHRSRAIPRPPRGESDEPPKKRMASVLWVSFFDIQKHTKTVENRLCT